MGRWVKTRLSEETYRRVLEYAEKRDISVYRAVRELIEAGLKKNLTLEKLVSDNDLRV